MNIGDKVTALIYKRNQQWFPATIVREITKSPYRPGWIVQLEDGTEYWVLKDDVKERVEV